MEKCGFDRGCDCAALLEKRCDGCRFYKTKQQIVDGRFKAEQRLDSIPGGIRLYKKYYCGEGSK